MKVGNENLDINYVSTNDTVLIPNESIAISNNKLEKIIKRIIDIVGGLIGTIMLIPLTIIIYIANLIVKDKGPLFYTQKRVGKNGKVFMMYK